MGTTRRRKPKKLGRKLLAIRKHLGMSQTAMAKALKLKVPYTAISRFEHGKREPDVLLLLQYATLAGTTIDVLVDDKRELNL